MAIIAFILMILMNVCLEFGDDVWTAGFIQNFKHQIRGEEMVQGKEKPISVF